MKKTLRILTLSLVLALSVPSMMNAQLFDQWNKVLRFGVGFGSTYYAVGSLYNTTVPPIFAAFDVCIREDLGPGNLGVGGFLGYSAYRYRNTYFGGEYGWKYTTLLIAARGTYHFTDLVDKLDLYGGVLLGAKIVSNKEFGDVGGIDYSVNSSGPVFELFAGARYYLTDNFAGMAELGYGIAWLKIGVSFKF